MELGLHVAAGGLKVGLGWKYIECVLMVRWMWIGGVLVALVVGVMDWTRSESGMQGGWEVDWRWTGARLEVNWRYCNW